MRSELVNAALQVAWSQWSALGAQGTLVPPDHVIDLEALILLTPSLGNEDPRLLEEALDWCVLHAQRLISIARLRRLRSALADEARDAYDGFAASVNATAKPKTPWPTSRTGSKTRTSQKSQIPEIHREALLQLRLRCLFGVTARAEILLEFLRGIIRRELAPIPVSDLAELGYSKPAIVDVLADLAMAGVLHRWRRGNRDYYGLESAQIETLQALVDGALPKAAPSWVLRFRIISDLLSAEAATQDKKPVVQAVAILKQLQKHRPALERLAIAPPRRAQTWPELTAWARVALLDDPPPASTEGFSRWRRRKEIASVK